MARTGRPRTPTALKKLKGTLKASRERGRHEWMPPAGAPPQPDDLAPIEAREWQRLVELLVPVGILTTADGDVLRARCVAYGRALAADADVRRRGITVASADGVKRNPACLESRQNWDAVTKLGSMLGLDPAARAKLAAPPPAKPKAEVEAEADLFGKPLAVVNGGRS